MNIIHLPKDVIIPIVAYSHRYNLIYVNKHFKNMLYTNFVKCDTCNKIVKINNNNLWNSNFSGECHTIKNFMYTNKIQIFDDVYHNGYNSVLNSLCGMSQELIFKITDKVKIGSKLKSTQLLLKSNVINHDDMQYIKGKYSINLYYGRITIIIKYPIRTILLQYENNIYTKCNCELYVVFHSEDHTQKILLNKL